MKNSQTQHIIFDLTGVLFHSSRLRQFRSIGFWRSIFYVITHRKNPVSRFLQLLQQLHKQEPDGYPIIYYKGTPLPRCMSDFMCGTIDNKEITFIINNYIKALIEQNYFHSNLEIDLMRKIVQTIIDGIFALEPDWNMVKLIQNLKKNNYTLYLLSNFDKESYKQLFGKYPEIFKLFEHIIISADIQMLKPYHNIYNHLLEKYHIKPAECLFIDDQQENIHGAQKVGIHGLHYTNLNILLKDFKNYHIITE